MDLGETSWRAACQGDAAHISSGFERWPVARLHERDVDGNTPLHNAASAAKADIVRLLLERGAHPFARNAARATPLHLATLVNAVEVVRTLVEHGADPQMLSNQGNCLMIAARMGHPDLVDIFLRDQSWSRRSLWGAMLEALRRLHVDIADKFRKHGIDIHAKTDGGVGFLHSSVGDDEHIATTRYLLKEAVDPNSADEKGARPLHIAAFNAGPPTVAELLAAGADPDAQDIVAGTPLFAAIQKSNVESVRLLLAAGANAKHVVRIGLKQRSLLHIASQGGPSTLEMAKLLVNYGADPNIRDETGALAAKWAASAGHIGLLRYFHELGCDVLVGDDNMSTPLIAACLNGHLDCARFLVDSGANCNATSGEGHTALVAAVQESHLNVVAYLLEKGAADSGALGCAFEKRDADAVQTVLAHHLRLFGDDHGQIKRYIEIAVSENNYQLAKELVRGIANIEAFAESTRNSLLFMAASHGAADLGRRVVEANPSRNHRQKVSMMTPVHAAAEGGHVELVSVLADAGFLTTSETQFGQTALHLAAKNGHVAVIKRLGGVVSTKVKDMNGRCPIHWAAVGGHSDCVRALIDLGSHIDPHDNGQRTPLHWAVESGHVDCVQTLLEHGSDARAVDQRSRTCLHLASLLDRIEALQLLLPRMADTIDYRDSLGFTALHFAKSQPATKLLRQYGASALENESLGMSGLEVFALEGNVYLVEELLSQSPHLLQSRKLITKLFMASWEQPDYKVFDYLLGMKPGLELLDDRQFVNLLAECIVRSDEHRILAALKAAFCVGRGPPRGTVKHLLTIACKSGFLETVRLLAEIPGIHDVDLRGWSPLLVACKHGHLRVVESLLESGANPTAMDPNSGQSAVKIAKAADHKDIIQSLDEYIRFQGAKHSRSLQSKQ